MKATVLPGSAQGLVKALQLDLTIVATEGTAKGQLVSLSISLSRVREPFFPSFYPHRAQSLAHGKCLINV